MKKLLIALFVLVLIVGAGLLFFAGKLDGLIKEAIETEGSAALGSPVRVTEVVTNLKEGSATISGLTIANPAGYRAANAIEINSFSATVDYGNQLIEELVIDKPVINAEQKGQQNNFQDLLNNMPDSGSEEPKADQGDEIEITIKRLALQNATINLITSDLAVGDQSIELGDRSFVMDDFVINNLTGTVTEISDELVSRLTNHVSDQVKGYVAKEITKMAKDKVFEKATEKLNEAIEEKLGDQLDGRLKGLKLKFGSQKD